MGIIRNLSSGEILSQIFLIQNAINNPQKANIVFMGMGEPLLNLANVIDTIETLTSEWGFAWSPKRVTVSTAGIVPEIIRLGELRLGINLAVSLNAADEKTRSRLMPINRKYPLKLLLKALNEFPLPSKQDFITFEYVLIKNQNDSEVSAKRLTKILSRKRSKINLIAYNPGANKRYQAPPYDRVLMFQSILQSANFNVLIRKSRGPDISAACGQLAGNYHAAPGDEQ